MDKALTLKPRIAGLRTQPTLTPVGLAPPATPLEVASRMPSFSIRITLPAVFFRLRAGPVSLVRALLQILAQTQIGLRITVQKASTLLPFPISKHGLGVCRA